MNIHQLLLITFCFRYKLTKKTNKLIKKSHTNISTLMNVAKCMSLIWQLLVYTYIHMNMNF